MSAREQKIQQTQRPTEDIPILTNSIIDMSTWKTGILDYVLACQNCILLAEH